MKNRFLLSIFLPVLLLTGVFIANGCKDTASDPTYVALAEIRFADYHQVDPIQIFMYPPNATSTDSATKTPTAMTYADITGYFNNLPTNRSAGMTYHLVAKLAGTNTVVASRDVTLMPGDKKTWIISGDGQQFSGTFDETLVEDIPPANQPNDQAYFRFINLTPAFTGTNSLSLIVGDPISGMHLATDVDYKGISPYVGLKVAKDTAVTFYVVSKDGAVLSRLSGVGLAAGTYHTITWGGEKDGFRIPDANSGDLTLDDTTRIRIIDDEVGTDPTHTAPLTFRYNVINALIPPQFPNAKLIDYTQPGPTGQTGLSIVLNNNTVYDYQGLMPFSLAPASIHRTDDGVDYVVPATTNLVDKIYFIFAQPAFKNPSSSDKILFRFFAANRTSIKSDQLYAVVVFDTVRAPVSLVTSAYDSAGGTTVVPIPDVPIAGKARIVYGYMLAPAAPPLKVVTANNGAAMMIDTGTGLYQDKNDYSTGRLLPKFGTTTKTFDSSLVVPADGRTITLTSTLATFPDITFSFKPEPGAIYEAFVVGRRGSGADGKRTDGMYGPRFMVVRVNP